MTSTVVAAGIILVKRSLVGENTACILLRPGVVEMRDQRPQMPITMACVNTKKNPTPRAPTPVSYNLPIPLHPSW